MDARAKRLHALRITTRSRPEPKVQRIQEVTDVSIALLKSFPAKLLVAAAGKVPTTGWTNSNLSAWVYLQPPADGIQDFDFCAEEPGDIVLQVERSVDASLMINRAPQNYWGSGKPLVGVRIHAKANTLVRKTSEPQVEASFVGDATKVQDRPIWPWKSSMDKTTDGGADLWPWLQRGDWVPWPLKLTDLATLDGRSVKSPAAKRVREKK